MQQNKAIIYVERLESHALTSDSGEPNAVLSLAFEDRQKARFKSTLTTGQTVGLKLPRGTLLRGGDVVRSDQGDLCYIEASAEQVSTVRSDDRQVLARVAYHLGNRHVWVQVGDGWLRYLHDHVLDQMVSGLGVTATSERVPFEPEGGAYSVGGHSHSHSHSPDDDFGAGKIHHSHD